jgi:hypothetical protein
VVYTFPYLLAEKSYVEASLAHAFGELVTIDRKVCHMTENILP